MVTESPSCWEINIQYMHKKHSLIFVKLLKNVKESRKCSYVMASISLSNQDKI